MALLHSFEKSGNFLFRWRGYFPVLIVLLVIPSMFFTDYEKIGANTLGITGLFSILLSLIGFIVRAWAVGTTPKGTSGRNTQSQVAESLNTEGIYSVVRHPLYLGNFLMWAGIMMFTANIYVFVISGLLFWIYYERIMFAEERFLEKKYGQRYLDWSMKVPAFIPAFGKYRRGALSFSIKTVLKREYSGVLAVFISFCILDYLKYFLQNGEYRTVRISLIATGIMLITALILRSLKHYTHVLEVKDRS